MELTRARCLSVAKFHTNQSKKLLDCVHWIQHTFHLLKHTKKNFIFWLREHVSQHTNQLGNVQAANHLCNCFDNVKICVEPINRGRLFFLHKHKQFSMVYAFGCMQNVQFRFLSIGFALLCFTPNGNEWMNKLFGSISTRKSITLATLCSFMVHQITKSNREKVADSFLYFYEWKEPVCYIVVVIVANVVVFFYQNANRIHNAISDLIDPFFLVSFIRI